MWQATCLIFWGNRFSSNVYSIARYTYIPSNRFFSKAPHTLGSCNRIYSASLGFPSSFFLRRCEERGSTDIFGGRVLSWGVRTPHERASSKGFYSIQKRDFAYYRFHKRIGKGHWNRYIERYIRPSSIENKQRLIFNYKPSFEAAKQSLSWLWKLPKAVAAATNASDVLDAWVHYRKKKKSASFYYSVLERLIAVGGCDPFDWRFQVITKDILKKPKHFIDLPRLMLYLSKLSSVQTVERLTKFAYDRLHLYSPLQLSLLSESLSNARLQDRFLFSKIAEYFLLSLPHASPNLITSCLKAYSQTYVHCYDFFSSISKEILRRAAELPLQAEKEESADSSSLRVDEGEIAYFPSSYSSSHESHLKDDYFFTLKDLSVVGRCFASLKYQDFAFFEFCSQNVYEALTSSNVEIDPYTLTRMIEAYIVADIVDIPLLVTVLHHMDKYLFEYPPSCVARIGVALLELLDKDEKLVKEASWRFLLFLGNHIDVMHMRSLQKTASFAALFVADCEDKKLKKRELVESIGDRVCALATTLNTQKKHYDLPEFLEAMTKLGVERPDVYDVLNHQLHHHLRLYEPKDFIKTLNSLVKVKESCGFSDLRAINAISRHFLRHFDEFEDEEFITLADSLIHKLCCNRRYSSSLLKICRKKLMSVRTLSILGHKTSSSELQSLLTRLVAEDEEKAGSITHSSNSEAEKGSSELHTHSNKWRYSMKRFGPKLPEHLLNHDVQNEDAHTLSKLNKLQDNKLLTYDLKI